MDIRRVFAFLVVTLACLLVTQSGAAQTRAIQASGTAEIGSDSLRAREKACANGTRSAVERAMESILDPNAIKANRRDIDDLLAAASRYAQRTEILQEGPADKEYRCRVRVTVDTARLASDLKEPSARRWATSIATFMGSTSRRSSSKWRGRT